MSGTAHGPLALAAVLAVLFASGIAAPTVRAEAPMGAAEELRLLGTDPASEPAVDFAMVLANPDDVRTNLRYARQQVQAGNLRGASTALERVQLLAPQLLRVRLFHAAVLFRLGNLYEAERELERVAGSTSDSALASEAEAYLARIARARQRTRISGAASLGVQYDSNRNASPVSESVLFQDQRVPLSGAARPENDYALLAALDLSLEHELANREGSRLRGGLQLFDTVQSELDVYELQAFRVELGAELPGAGVLWRPVASAAQLRLDGETYVESAAIELAARRPLSSRLSVAGSLAYEYQSVKDLDASAQSSDRSGGGLRLLAQADLRPAPGQRLGVEATLSGRNAREAYHGYRSGSVALSYSRALGNAWGLGLRSALSHDRYLEPQEFVSARKRRDTRWSNQISLSVPLAAVIAQLRVEHLGAHSNLRNYTYRNLSVSWVFTVQLP